MFGCFTPLMSIQNTSNLFVFPRMADMLCREVMPTLFDCGMLPMDKPRHDLLYASASLSRLDMPGANPCLAAPVFSPYARSHVLHCVVLCVTKGNLCRPK